MIEDKELDQLSAAESMKENASKVIIVKENNQALDSSKIDLNTEFAQKMDEVKQNVLVDASATDDNFVNAVKKNVKEAAVKLTEVEKEKANLQEQQVNLEQDKLTTKQNQEKHTQNADKWDDKRKKRQFHYDGVKPIMESVGIIEPMNLFFLYFLAAVLTPLFLIGKFCRGSFGALLAGANDKDRCKAAKGFLWTLLAVFALITVICLILLFLKTQGIDVFANIKS
jgi:hypothetical protein